MVDTRFHNHNISGTPSKLSQMLIREDIIKDKFKHFKIYLFKH